MKHLILYSTYVPDVSKLDIAIDILNQIIESFPDGKIIIGDSFKSIDIWKSVVEEYQRNKKGISYSKYSEKYLIDSDAGGFQQCLLKMWLRDYDYDFVWFVHTKGITNDKRKGIRNTLVNELLKERFSIENYFKEHIDLGSYGFMITKDPIENRINNNINSICEYPFDAEGLFYPHTWYVLRGDIVKHFLDNVNSDFFDNNLLDLNFDRYFFERDFIGIVQMMGYKMGYRNWKQHQYLGTQEEALKNSILL